MRVVPRPGVFLSIEASDNVEVAINLRVPPDRPPPTEPAALREWLSLVLLRLWKAINSAEPAP